MQVSEVISVCTVLANNFPCDVCNLLEMFSDSFQCPPQQPPRLAIPSHPRHVNTFLSHIAAYCTLPSNSRSQRKMLMAQCYTNLIIRVPVSPSNTRQRTCSKEHLFICPTLQMETEQALLMELLGVTSSLFSVMESNTTLVHLSNTSFSNTTCHLP